MDVPNDILYKAASVWKKLSEYSYVFTYGYKKRLHTINLTFSMEDFPHLAGFQYLKDISLPRYNSGKIVDKILDYKITYRQISKGIQYAEMVDYETNQRMRTLLKKERIHIATNTSTVLYDRLEVDVKEERQMFYSYVMGIDNPINELRNHGFPIDNDGENYMVSFSKENAIIWEEFVKKHLEVGYWNEYLTDNSVIFLFHLQDGFKRYEVYDFIDDEVLGLCENLCECKLESLKSMLMGNHFYKEVLNQKEVNHG